MQSKRYKVLEKELRTFTDTCAEYHNKPLRDLKMSYSAGNYKEMHTNRKASVSRKKSLCKSLSMFVSVLIFSYFLIW